MYIDASLIGKVAPQSQVIPYVLGAFKTRSKCVRSCEPRRAGDCAVAAGLDAGVCSPGGAEAVYRNQASR